MSLIPGNGTDGALTSCRAEKACLKTVLITSDTVYVTVSKKLNSKGAAIQIVSRAYMRRIIARVWCHGGRYIASRLSVYLDRTPT